MPWKFVSWGSALLGGWVVGCSGDDVSLDGSGGAGPGGASDASLSDGRAPRDAASDVSPPRDAASTGRALDGGEAEAGPGVDASPGLDASPRDSASDAANDGPVARDLSTERARFFGASRCAAAGLQFCEDFESGTLDTRRWTTGGNAPLVGTEQHARGTYALHVTKDGNGGSYIQEKKTFPAAGNAYFGRAFVYFTALPAAPMTYAHWTILAASGSKVSGEVRLGGQLQNGKNLFGVGTDNRVDDAGTGDWTISDNDPAGKPREVPTGEWMCLEWMHDGGKNQTRFFWDAVEHSSLSTTTQKSGSTTGQPFILPQFDTLWIGWDEYQTATERFEMWVDEIAIDPLRVGCVL